MNKLRILLVGVMLLNITCKLSAEEKKLGVTFDLTYTSRYLSKGSLGYGQKGGIFETLDLDFWGTGFGLQVKHRNSTSSGYVDKQRFDYRPYYKGQLFEETPLVTKYNISCGYEHYYGLDRKKANTTFEWIFAFRWPQIIGNGFVPSYIAHYEYPAGSEYKRHDITGWVHRFGLSYDMKIKYLPSPLHLSSEIAYRDGLGGPSKDRDWSHATLGISTKFKINKNFSFVPGVYYQISMDDSVCKTDPAYCKLSMKYKF